MRPFTRDRHVVTNTEQGIAIPAVLIEHPRGRNLQSFVLACFGLSCYYFVCFGLSGRGSMGSGGQSLRVLREQLGLTMRDVENSSSRIAERHGNDEFAIAPSRLSDFETKGVIPSIYRFYSLAVIYRRDIRELLSW